jgi:hypothetical protein
MTRIHSEHTIPVDWVQALPGASLRVPAAPMPNAPGASPPVSSGTWSSLLSNIGPMRDVVARMGGIEGIVGFFSKMQKFMQTLQQMRPWLQLLMRVRRKRRARRTAPLPVRRRRRRRRRALRS